ncbi:MAG: type II toxin-antitoxin system VapB family antitoxin [Spirochaetales bacterium]|nr:type II toxin-antitoxin system VapB family antitoxin [Spirochaetales bacterium]
MERTTLMLDEQLLEEARRIAAGSTISGTVNLALKDFVRRARARRILELAGTGAWSGSLAEMRRDQRPPRRHRG